MLLWTWVCKPLFETPLSIMLNGILKSHDSLFNILGNCHIVVLSYAIILYFHKKCKGSNFFTSLPTLVTFYFVFLVLGIKPRASNVLGKRSASIDLFKIILIGMVFCLIVLIPISLMMSNVDYLFMYLLWQLVYFWRYPSYLSIGAFCVWLTNFLF